MSWSSNSRLQAINPHATFALTHIHPCKTPNPLLSSGDHNTLTHIHTTSAIDFSRTIPLSDLMNAELAQTQTGFHQSLGKTGTRSSTASMMNATRSMNHSLSPSSSTQKIIAMSKTLRVPPAMSYSTALESMHHQRRDRLIRQEKGWSQHAAIKAKRQKEEEKEERIAIYQPGVHEEILQDALSVPSSSSTRPSHSSSRFIPSSSRSLSSTANAALSVAMDPRLREEERTALAQKKLKEFWEEVAASKERLHIKLQERMAKNAEKEEKNFQILLGHLNENKELLAEINDYLELKDAEDHRRKEQLYQRWCAQIYAPIQEAIAEGLASRSTSEIERRRIKLFNDFLRISNEKKEGLYNDVIIERDYNPLESRSYNLRIKTSHLSDPLKQSREQSEEEWKIQKAFDPQATRIVHQVKTTLPPPIWAKYKIESTPHGRYSLLKGNLQKAVGKKLVEPSASYSEPFTTANSLDHYSIDTDPATVKYQFWSHGGKRVEGYEGVSDKVDWNILSNTTPSYKAMYGSPSGSQGNIIKQSPPATQQGYGSPSYNDPNNYNNNYNNNNNNYSMNNYATNNDVTTPNGTRYSFPSQPVNISSQLPPISQYQSPQQFVESDYQ